MRFQTVLQLLAVFFVCDLTVGAVYADMVRVAQYEVLPLASKSARDGGFASRITTAAFALSDHDVVIDWYPIKRAFTLVERGAADMSLGWRKTPEREKTVIFSDEPLLDSSVLLYFRADRAFEWNTVDDLKGLRLGALIGGASLSKEVLALEEAGQLTIELVTSSEQNIKRLLAGRIDILVGSPLSDPFVLEAKFLPEERQKIVAHPKPLIDVRYYAVFSKNISPDLILAFNQGIKQLRDDGRYMLWLQEALSQEVDQQ